MTEDDSFAVIGDWSGFDDYRGALVILENPEGRILLQLRDHLTLVQPNKWGLFGGGVEAGETLVEAASRELSEELGISVPQANLTPVARLVTAGTFKRLYCFVATVDVSPAKIVLGEGAGFGFFAKADAANLPLVASTRAFLEFWQDAKAAKAGQ